jgi:co-chaperonin GroES (HSP10)
MVTDMNFDSRTTASGIIINSDDGKDTGIKPRWGRVVAVGPEQKDVVPGEWVLVSHGRWTRGIKTLDQQGNEMIVRFVDVKEMIMTADSEPAEEFGSISSVDFSPTHRPEHFV